MMPAPRPSNAVKTSSQDISRVFHVIRCSSTCLPMHLESFQVLRGYRGNSSNFTLWGILALSLRNRPNGEVMRKHSKTEMGTGQNTCLEEVTKIDWQAEEEVNCSKAILQVTSRMFAASWFNNLIRSVFQVRRRSHLLVPKFITDNMFFPASTLRRNLCDVSQKRL